MPFTPDMRRKVDQIRDYLYGGGYPDPTSSAASNGSLSFHDRNVKAPRMTGDMRLTLA